MTPETPYRVTFVCTGNICRSPIAEVVLAHAVREAGLDDRVVVDSVGTGDWHVGNPADPRAVAALRGAGLDGSRHRARVVDPEAVAGSDLVVALDAGHERHLGGWLHSSDGRLRLLRSFDPDADDDLDVADPYYGDDSGFDVVVEQVRAAVPGLLERIRADLGSRSTAP